MARRSYRCPQCKGNGVGDMQNESCPDCKGEGSVPDLPWEKTPYYCLNCGEQAVWQVAAIEADDFYIGQQCYCTACTHGFFAPFGIDARPGYRYEAKRVAKL